MPSVVFVKFCASLREIIVVRSPARPRYGW